MFTTRRIEHGLPLLSDFDLSSLMAARSNPEANVAGIMESMAKAGKSRVIRKLSAVVHATEDQLRQAESDPKVMATLEEEAAMRSFAETFGDAIGFFVEWGNSLNGTPASLDSATTMANPASVETPADSPLGAS